MKSSVRAVLLGMAVATGPAWATTEAAPAANVAAADVVQVGLGLGAILLLIVVFGWLARRWLHIRPGGQGQIRILGGLAMGARDRIVLLQVGETQLLVGVSPGRMNTLHVLDEPLSAPQAESRSAGSRVEGFAMQMGRALRGGQRD